MTARREMVIVLLAILILAVFAKNVVWCVIEVGNAMRAPR